MKTWLPIFVLAFAAVCSTASQSGVKMQALLISGQMNQYHNVETMDRTVTRYLEETGLFDVTHVRTPAAGEDMSGFAPDFANYDVVVLNYDGADWPAATIASFEAYMRNGGGLVSVHSTDNAFPNWPAFNDMIALGGWNGRNEDSGPAVRWTANGIEHYDGPGETFHPPPHDFVVSIRDTDHPITDGLPLEWLHATDELYSMLRGPAKNLTVLATGIADPSLTNTSPYGEPVLMAVEYGKGRVFHTTLGHIRANETEAPESVRCVGFAVTLQRGTEWAATGDVTQPLPDEFPDATTKLLR